MLIPNASHGSLLWQHRFGTPDSHLHDAGHTERMRFQEQAELLAHVGLFEIAIGQHGEDESQHWSAGIYAILHRDRSAPPLRRSAYVLQYVHPDDQQRVLGLSRQAMEQGHTLQMAYRVIRDDGCVACVTEQLTAVASTQTQRLLFGDLKEIQHGDLTAGTARDAPVALPPTAHAGVVAFPDVQGLIATFDALREREQRRMAREMHDDFGQLLAAMKLDVCMLKKKLTHGDSSALPQLQNLQELVDTMIASTRRIITELPPKAVDELGLFPALEQLVAGFRKRHPLRLTTRLMPPPNRLDPGVELAAYRVLQEALNNIVRHAGATTAVIDVECSASHLRLQVSDNGKGTSAADIAKSGSLGLLWMRERVLSLAGNFVIDSVDGQGTSITISLPLQPATKACDP